MCNPPIKSTLLVRHIETTPPQSCPCGFSQRIITKTDFPHAGLHITTIKSAQKHYHKKTTEIYYILEGKGILEVGGQSIPLTPGATVLIPPETPHRGEGDFKSIIVTVPAFDPSDEFIIDE